MLFSDQKTRIYTLALDLTSSEAAARKIVKAVLSRLKNEVQNFSPDDLEELIHRFTYDAALPMILDSETASSGEVESCCSWLTRSKRPAIC